MFLGANVYGGGSGLGDAIIWKIVKLLGFCGQRHLHHRAGCCALTWALNEDKVSSTQEGARNTRIAKFAKLLPAQSSFDCMVYSWACQSLKHGLIDDACHREVGY